VVEIEVDHGPADIEGNVDPFYFPERVDVVHGLPFVHYLQLSPGHKRPDGHRVVGGENLKELRRVLFPSVPVLAYFFPSRYSSSLISCIT
jgi:hypothetical protein